MGLAFVKGTRPEDVVLWPDQISCQESVSDSRGALCGSTVQCIKIVTTEIPWGFCSAAAPGGTRALFPAQNLAGSAGIFIHIFPFFKLSVYLGNLQDSPVNVSMISAKPVGWFLHLLV